MMRNNLNRKLMLLLLSLAVSGCASSPPSPPISEICATGYNQAKNRNFTASIPLLTTCIESKHTPVNVKRNALIARAWSYNHLDKHRAAVIDQYTAFKLGPPSYPELINYALYLRASGRAHDSLAPLKKAEAMDKARGWTSMMTQYQLGWTYQTLGRNQQAIAAFSKGLKVQKDYGFAYYRRGLSYESLGKDAQARADFKKAYELIRTSRLDATSMRVFQELLKKMKQYGIKTIHK